MADEATAAIKHREYLNRRKLGALDMREPRPGDLVVMRSQPYFGLLIEPKSLTPPSWIVALSNGLEVEATQGDFEQVSLRFDAMARQGIGSPANFAEWVRARWSHHMERARIFQEIHDNRVGAAHDDQSENEETFTRSIVEHATQNSDRTRAKDFRARMVDVAALAVKAIERHDRLAKENR